MSLKLRWSFIKIFQFCFQGAVFWPKWLVPEVVNAHAEVGDPGGGQAREREKQEGQRHQERDTTEDAEKKGQAGKQSKKETECCVGQGPLDSKKRVR